MIPVSLGDQDHSKTNPISEDSGPECCSAVCKDEVCVPNAHSFKVVEQAKSGDGEGLYLSYPKCFMMWDNSQLNTQQRGMVDGKQGMIQVREQIWQVFSLVIIE